MRHQGQLILSNPQNGGAQVTLLIKNFRAGQKPNINKTA